MRRRLIWPRDYAKTVITGFPSRPNRVFTPSSFGGPFALFQDVDPSIVLTDGFTFDILANVAEGPNSTWLLTWNVPQWAATVSDPITRLILERSNDDNSFAFLAQWDIGGSFSDWIYTSAPGSPHIVGPPTSYTDSDPISFQFYWRLTAYINAVVAGVYNVVSAAKTFNLTVTRDQGTQTNVLMWDAPFP